MKRKININRESLFFTCIKCAYKWQNHDQSEVMKVLDNKDNTALYPDEDAYQEALLYAIENMDNTTRPMECPKCNGGVKF